MSKVQVDTIDTRSGTSTMQIGSTNTSTINIGVSGDTVNIPSGVTIANAGTATGFGGGKINQVLQTVKTDTFSTTSTSDFDITGMSVAITPSASNSKILVLANLNSSASVYSQSAWISIVRDSTQIYRGDADGSRRRATWGYEDAGSNEDEQKFTTHLMSFQFLDTPSTTSQVTYKLTGIKDNQGTFYVNRTAADGNSNAYGRVPSSITVMEVLA